jgi:tetratricopeptide (TPR) repeat protein
MANAVVVLPVSNLTPAQAADLERWRNSFHRVDSQLKRVIGGWYGALSPHVSVRLASTNHSEGDEVLEFFVDVDEVGQREAALRCYDLGILLFEAGNPAAAVPLFEQAIRREGREARFHRAQGSALLALGNLEDSEDCLLRGLKLSPGDAVGRLLLGDLYLARGRYKLAADVFNELLELHETALHFTKLGTALAAMKESVLAAECFRNALALDPESKEARMGLMFEGEGRH